MLGVLRQAGATEEYQTFSQAWSDFLTAIARVYNALEAGKKSSPKSEKWFSGKRNDRKRDELLRYLHQARHADEHGIAPIVTHRQPFVTVGHGDHVSVDRFTMKNGVITNLFGIEDGKPLTARVYLEGVRLMPVTNRGITYAPPAELAAVTAFRSVADGVSPAISYCWDMVAEAGLHIID